MKNDFMQRVKNFVQRNKEARQWRRTVATLSVIVLFATINFLTLPAITMTNVRTPSNATPSNAGSSIATGSNASDSNAMLATPSDALPYRCGVDDPDHVHSETCFYPEEFTLDMIEAMDMFVEAVEALPDIDTIHEYKELEARGFYDRADWLLMDEMELDEDTIPYEEVEILVGRALEAYTTTVDCFLEEYPDALAEELDEILENDYIYGPAFEYLTDFVDVWYGAEILIEFPSEREDDCTVVEEDIEIHLFNYKDAINKELAEDDLYEYRPISSYLVFSNPALDDEYINAEEEQETEELTNYCVNLEKVLDEDGNPILDLSRNADGTYRLDSNGNALEADDILTEEERSLAYLFDEEIGDHAVEYIAPDNTVLQKEGSYYWYRSDENAVDYDPEDNIFRVRSYKEQTSVSEKDQKDAYDFLPFTYTDGDHLEDEENCVTEAVAASYVDYWYGMTMEFDFFQTKSGMIPVMDEETGETEENEMRFSFSGDDDAWVFVDDVLVLDLGGMDGMRTGTINFATGEIEVDLEGSEDFFSSTLEDCFDAAQYIDSDGETKWMTPNGGWNSEGAVFADHTKHRLKLFYLERDAETANCSIEFELPVLPEQSLTVTKELDWNPDEEETTFLGEGPLYAFRVMKADDEGVATSTPFIGSGTPYDIYENGLWIDEGVVDENNLFFLKANQSAQFTDLDEYCDGTENYIVEEIPPVNQMRKLRSVRPGGAETMTETLSSDTTQAIICRSVLDASQLGTLKVTKNLAQGAELPEDQTFDILVEISDTPIPLGALYYVGEEMREVEEAGYIGLKLGETALLADGIVAGSGYEISEKTPENCGYIGSYSGTVKSQDGMEIGIVNCEVDRAYGDVPAAGEVHVTVTNADYDCSVEVLVNTECIDNDADVEFTVRAEEVEYGSWEMKADVPDIVIEVSDEKPVTGKLILGFKPEESGTFYYKISEGPADGNYICDTTYYIVEAVVDDNRNAAITNIWANGDVENRSAAPVSFVNRKTTSLTITNKLNVTDQTAEPKAIQFSVEVTLDGQPFDMPIPDGEAKYTVDKNIITLYLQNESVTIPNIPYRAEVVVKEVDHSGFVPYCQVLGRDSRSACTDSVSIVFGENSETVEFTNFMGMALPETGGIGTHWFTICGLLITLATMLFGFEQTRRGRR